MKSLIGALCVIVIVGLCLWHFDPSAITGNLEGKIHRKLPGKKPLIYRCSLQQTFYLLGPSRRKHNFLTPEEVALKHIIADVLNDTEAYRETLPPAKAATVTERKLKRKERRRLEKTISKNRIYTATIDTIGGSCATVHILEQLSKKESCERWCLLSNTAEGWVVTELSNQEL